MARKIEKTINNSSPSKEILKEVEPIIENVQKGNCFKVEELTLKLLENIFKKYPTKPTKDNKAVQKDYLTVKFLWVGFDDYFKERFSIKEKIATNGFHNYYLISCCHNPQYLDRILLEITNYLLWIEPYYYNQQELLKALSDYKDKKQINLFEKSAPYHHLKTEK